MWKKRIQRYVGRLRSLRVMGPEYLRRIQVKLGVPDEIAFHADQIAAQQEPGYPPSNVVHGIYLGRGDPRRGGHYWSFDRIIGPDDQGVCIVKGAQHGTIYEGIKAFSMTRTGLICEFDQAGSEHMLARRLVITYEVDDDEWSSMIEQAQQVFKQRQYFTLSN